MRPGADWKQLEAKMPAFCEKYMNSNEWAKKNEIKNEVHFIPLNDIHLYSNVNQEAEVNGNGQDVATTAEARSNCRRWRCLRPR